MKIKFTNAITIMIAILMSVMTGCACKHEKWNEADCTTPKTCVECGIIEGEVLNHKWIDADCENPQICSVCGEKQGEPLGHNYSDPTCKEALKCLTCGEIIGQSLGHKWEEATCDKPKTCTVCGKTEGEANGHKWVDATIVSAKKCSVCGKTEGEPLNYSYLGTGKVSVKSGSLNFRKKPDINSEILKTIPNKTSIEIYDCNNSEWYYIEYDGNYGYVSSEFISLKSNESNQKTSLNNDFGNSSGDSLEKKFSSLEEYCDFANQYIYPFQDYLYGGDIDITYKAMIGTVNNNQCLVVINYTKDALKTQQNFYNTVKTTEQVIKSLKDKGITDYDLINDYKDYKKIWNDLRDAISEACLVEQEKLVSCGLINYSVVYCQVDMEKGENFNFNEMMTNPSNTDNMEGVTYISIDGKIIYDIIESNGIDWNY